MAPHPSPLAWKIPRTEEHGRLQSMGSLGVGHDWVTSLSLFTFMHRRRKRQPTPVFLPGESQGRGSLVGCRLWGHRVGHDWSDLAAAAAAKVNAHEFFSQWPSGWRFRPRDTHLESQHDLGQLLEKLHTKKISCQYIYLPPPCVSSAIKQGHTSHRTLQEFIYLKFLAEHLGMVSVQ